MGTTPEPPVISRVDFHFDVMCPFAYQTAKWIRDVRAQNGLDICNGNKIDDRKRCTNKDCSLYRTCDRITLKTGDKSCIS